MKKYCVLLMICALLIGCSGTSVTPSADPEPSTEQAAFETEAAVFPTAFPTEMPEEENRITYTQWKNAGQFLDRYDIQLKLTIETDWSERGRIVGWDDYDTPYLDSSSINRNDMPLEWKTDWQPYPYTLKERTENLLPQIWDYPAALQDLFSLRLEDGTYVTEYGAECSIENLADYLSSSNRPETEVFSQNLQRIRSLVEMQQERYSVIDSSIVVDLDNDGTAETVEVRNEEDGGQFTSALIINGIKEELFPGMKMEFALLNLGNNKVIWARPVDDSGEETAAAGRSIKSVIYGFKQNKLRFLGAVNGDFFLYTGEGRFLTKGTFDQSERYGIVSYGMIEGVVHEYVVTREQHLYHVLHGKSDTIETPYGWQPENTTWKLKHDLAVFNLDGYTVSQDVIKEGTTVLISGISENGFLWMIDEFGNQGIVRLIQSDKNELDPYLAPGGRELTFYLEGYDGIANAG